MTPSLRVAVVGAGWAGLAAAVRATQAGHRVTLLEMASQAGGRARSVTAQGRTLDNGQHILIGAYSRTLALMATVQADAGQLLHRQPLELRYPDGNGLQMPAGPPWLVFGWAVARRRGWRWSERLALMRAAAGWALRRFDCPASMTVQELCHQVPAAVRAGLIDPLCVAALNTPAEQASARVFLRVLRDALFSGPGSADLLLPRQPLGHLLPEPGAGWLLDGQAFDAVILASSASEAARLAQPHAPGWAATALALRYEPIITVWLQAPGARLICPMTALAEGPGAPAQYAFDHGALGGTPGLFAFVISGAAAWVDQGLDSTGQAVLRQAQSAWYPGTLQAAPTVLQVRAEKRATFACTPGLQRPGPVVAGDLLAAGDYIDGPYPATLEGAVRSGELAAGLLLPNRA